MSRFRINCIVRILLLAGSLFLFFTLLEYSNYRVTLFTVGLLILYQIVRLIVVVESTNRHVAQFLESISQSDFSQVPTPGNLGPGFDDLKNAYKEVLKLFRDSRAETEEKARYLQMVLQHVKIGLIGFNQNGKIEIYNNTAKKYLQKNQLRTTEDIHNLDDELAKTILNPELKPNTILKFESEGNYLQLVLNVSHLQFKNTRHTLISMSNIQSELEEKEMEAWQNLIRVLTHEIMNSITPISSLAGTTKSILQDEIKNEEAVNSTSLKQVNSAINTIHKRSESLLGFVENYRKLTRIPNPEFQHIVVANLMSRIRDLMHTQINESTTKISQNIEPKDLKITCDPNLIEQVLINLLRNAIQATQNQEDGKIEMNARFSSMGRVLLEITDNGCGIEKDVIDKIFIPFFTTKRDGSGIGLSFSRQVMRMHNGSIRVISHPDIETKFILTF